MIEPIPWIQRVFTFDQQLGIFPAIVERLRGTPARATKLVAGVSEEMLSTRQNKKWSVKEHLGHLVDLEPLDERRLCEFRDHVAVLSSADMNNRKTEKGNHRETPILEILRRLRTGRIALVQKLEQLTPEEIAVVSIHPRLQKPMRLMDWAHFVAEHDDHHLMWVTKTIHELDGY